VTGAATSGADSAQCGVLPGYGEEGIGKPKDRQIPPFLAVFGPRYVSKVSACYRSLHSH